MLVLAVNKIHVGDRNMISGRKKNNACHKKTRWTGRISAPGLIPRMTSQKDIQFWYFIMQHEFV